ncbi:unnamed protein product, partial [Didymodactylos carnosus]
ICMCIDLPLWYIRMLHVFAAFERLGPKLLMIFHTVRYPNSNIKFITMTILFYSISSYAMITTEQQVIWLDNNNGSPNYSLLKDGSGLWDWSLLRNVIDWGMWKIFGQVNFFDYQLANSATLNSKV